MLPYTFITYWKVNAPLPKVWEIIEPHKDWTSWWKGLQKIDVLQTGTAQGIGTIREFYWKSVLGYCLRLKMKTLRVEPMKSIEMSASGDLDGMGIWSFEDHGNYTMVRYHWQVIPRKKWLVLLSPVASRVFRWNHKAVMKRGAAGLSKKLNVPVIQDEI